MFKLLTTLALKVVRLYFPSNLIMSFVRIVNKFLVGGFIQSYLTMAEAVYTCNLSTNIFIIFDFMVNRSHLSESICINLIAKVTNF